MKDRKTGPRIIRTVIWVALLPLVLLIILPVWKLLDYAFETDAGSIWSEFCALRNKGGA